MEIRQRTINQSQLARLWKVTDAGDNLVYYINFNHVVSVSRNTSTGAMTIRISVDASGQGNQTTPITIEVDAGETDDLLAYLEAAWDVTIAGNTPP